MALLYLPDVMPCAGEAIANKLDVQRLVENIQI
jgi:hypothetical protein